MAAGERGKQIEELQARQREARALEEAKLATTAGEFGTLQTQLREDFLRQQGLTEGGFDPFVQAGLEGLQGVRQGATFAGRNESLQQIFNSPVFQALRDEQVREARGQFSASGQTGSGNALQFISQISPQLALQLEREQFNRQGGLAGQGFQAVGERGRLGNQLTLGQGGLSSNLAQRLGLIRTGVGSSQARGILGSAQLESGVRDQAITESRADDAAIFNAIVGLGGAVLGPALGNIGGQIAGLIPEFGGVSNRDERNII